MKVFLYALGMVVTTAGATLIVRQPTIVNHYPYNPIALISITVGLILLVWVILSLAEQ